MDQDQINEDGRVLGQYQDFDRQLDEFSKEYRGMPLEVHHRHDDEMVQYMREAGYQGVLGEAQQSVIIVDDAEQRAELDKVIAQATPEELARAKLKDGDKDLIESLGQGTIASPIQETGQAPGQDPGEATESARQPPRKPSSIESALASIQLSPVRQDRFIISGDPVVQQVFYDKLSRDGKLFYRGGQPIISASEKDTIKYLNEASRDVLGKDALFAASMSFDRQGSGVFGKLKAEIANKLGRYDETKFFVVGDEKTTSDKLKELGSLLTEMDKKGLVKPENVQSGDTPGFQLKDGELVVPKNGPVTLVRGEDIYDMIQIAKETSIRYNTSEEEKNLSRKEYKNRQEDEKIRGAEGKTNGAAVGAGAGDALAAETTKLVPPNKHTVKLANELDAVFASKEMLHSKNDRGQSSAVAVMYEARKLKDPVVPEIATLPTEQRQKFVTQLAAVMSKAEGKEFDKVNVDAQKDGVSVRDKITAVIAQEVERDPSFQEKAKELLKGYEAAGLVTEKQAEQVTGMIAEAVAQKATQQDQAGATVESAATPGAGSTDKSDQASSQEVPVSATADTVAATSGAAGKSEQGAEQFSQEVPQAPEKVEPTAPPAGADFGKEARELLDTVTEPGKKPDINLVASALYAAEDLRHFTVAALDNRTGDAPTKTLEKLDALVQASLKGEHGQEAQDVAQDTKTLVDRWKLEDAERVAQEGGAKTTQGEPEKATEAAQPTSPAPAASESGTAPASEKDAAASNQQGDASSGTQKDASASTAPEATPAVDKQQDARAEAAPQEQQVASPKEAASTAALGAESAAPQAQDPAQQSAVAADKPAAVEQLAIDPDREAKQQRFAETEIAAGKLAMLMDNPAGSFTNRDKSWNEGKIQEAADLVMRLDPDSVSQMSAKQRGAVMEYGTWMAMNAHSEKLPGFDSPDGKAKAEAMANHVAQIIGKFDGPTEISAGVEKSLEKADRMVAEKDRMSMEAERSGTASPEASGSAPTKRQAAESFAKDLVHMVYQKSELTEADVKYAMKGASQLTPQNMKQLSPELKAQATTALEFLAKEVREGGLGEFSSLPPALKKNVIGAQQVVNTLNAEFSRDSKVTTEMIKATEALPVTGGASSSAESTKSPVKGLDKDSGQDQLKSAGRELDR